MARLTAEPPSGPVGKSPEQIELPWQSRPVVYAVALGIVLVASALIFRLISPPVTQNVLVDDVQTINTDGTQTEFNQVRFVGVIPQIPDTLPIATAVLSNQASIEEKLSDQFGLEPLASAEGFWRGSDFSMYFDPKLRRYELVRNNLIDADSSLKPGFVEEELYQLANTKMNELFPNTVLELVSEEVVFSATTEHYGNTSIDTASLASIPFVPTVAGYQIFFDNSFLPSVELDIDTFGQVTKLEVIEPLVSFEEGQSVRTITVDEAIRQINNKNAGTIITAEVVEEASISIAQIERGTLSGVDVEYRFNTKTGRAIPFYRFSGIVENAFGAEYRVEIISPAVEVIAF